MKVNFDAAIDVRRNKGAIAVVVRDSNEKPLDWVCKFYDFIIDPLVLESLACREATQFAINRGFDSVIVEGDSLGVINALKERKDTFIPLSIQAVIHDVKKLTRSFNSVSFSFVKRSCNHAAHALATKFLSDASFSCNLVAQQIYVLGSLSV
ncbi:hypothetical protein P3X46_028283 [Hevea brasiliensis]|uniref:RNase H type-1 domain-containing protein n=1 Tax=Hevea brasiliensis TaxID=3981 RepID=A0ABQ9KNI3_HEVBR|nr:hypothetical protein P3X46_028283 [Hevea brasiliensis]